jgi:hypothetical protein
MMISEVTRTHRPVPILILFFRDLPSMYRFLCGFKMGIGSATTDFTAKMLFMSKSFAFFLREEGPFPPAAWRSAAGPDCHAAGAP